MVTLSFTDGRKVKTLLLEFKNAYGYTILIYFILGA